jgi:CheY-like chemotaxis protein
MVLEMTREMLEGLGYEVTSRSSSLESLEAFRADPTRFDLVITDQTMPKMTGEKLAQEIMDIRPDIPIILCTGFSATMTKEKARAMGIQAYIMKPILKKDLAETIKKCV